MLSSPSQPDLFDAFGAISADKANAVPGADNIQVIPLVDELTYEPASFRENPQAVICDDAENARESVLLKQMGMFHGEVLEMVRTAARTPDPHHKALFLNSAMTYSTHCMKLFEAIEKGRRTGRQEVVVKHQTVSPSATPRRVSRREAANVSRRNEAGEAQRA